MLITTRKCARHCQLMPRHEAGGVAVTREIAWVADCNEMGVGQYMASDGVPLFGRFACWCGLAFPG